jgi:hypothetical protein
MWKQNPAYYRIAKILGVNPATVWRSLKLGEEPKQAEIRVKFGLPKRPRKPKAEPKETKEIPNHRKWWSGIDPEIRDLCIKEAYEAWTQKN